MTATLTLKTSNGPVQMGKFIPRDRHTGLPCVTSEAYDAQAEAYDAWSYDRRMAQWDDYLEIRGDYEAHVAEMAAEWREAAADDPTDGEASTLAFEDAMELLGGDDTDMAQVYAVALCILRQRAEPETPWVE
jgi:hypothetical protein